MCLDVFIYVCGGSIKPGASVVSAVGERIGCQGARGWLAADAPADPGNLINYERELFC